MEREREINQLPSVWACTKDPTYNPVIYMPWQKSNQQPFRAQDDAPTTGATSARLASNFLSRDFTATVYEQTNFVDWSHTNTDQS